jgi:hypothetical protein
VASAYRSPGILARVLDRPRPLVLAWAGVLAAVFVVLALLVGLSRAPLGGFDDLGRSAESWARDHGGLVDVLRLIERAFAGIGMTVLTLLLAVPLWVRKHHRAAIYAVLVMVSDSLAYQAL